MLLSDRFLDIVAFYSRWNVKIQIFKIKQNTWIIWLSLPWVTKNQCKEINKPNFFILFIPFHTGYPQWGIPMWEGPLSNKYDFEWKAWVIGLLNTWARVWYDMMWMYEPFNPKSFQAKHARLESELVSLS